MSCPLTSAADLADTNGMIAHLLPHGRQTAHHRDALLTCTPNFAMGQAARGLFCLMSARAEMLAPARATRGQKHAGLRPPSPSALRPLPGSTPLRSGAMTPRLSILSQHVPRCATLAAATHNATSSSVLPSARACARPAMVRRKRYCGIACGYVPDAMTVLPSPALPSLTMPVASLRNNDWTGPP